MAQHPRPKISPEQALDSATEQLLQRPGFLLRRCLQLTSGVFEQSCAEIGLTARQYDYLFVLDIAEELGQTELAEAVGLDKATNTLVIKILERKQWVQRAVAPHDSRKKVVRITDDGRQVFASAKRAADRSICAVSNPLTGQEYEQLLALMRKVALHGDTSAVADVP